MPDYRHFKRCTCPVCTETRARRMAIGTVLAFLAGVVVVLLFLDGCAVPWKRGQIKAGPVSVQGVPNAGTPATVNTADAGTTIPLPAGSTITVTTEELSSSAPSPLAHDPSPVTRRETTTITPAGASEYRHTQATVAATTGTIDTTVAKHAIDVADRGKLLWVAIACGVAGVLARSLIPAWPAISNGLLLASALAFAGWKFAEVPAWLWLVALGIAALIVAVYKRAEWDKNGDGIPDVLQSRKENPPTKNP
jgi:hypothetical protein